MTALDSRYCYLIGFEVPDSSFDIGFGEYITIEPRMTDFRNEALRYKVERDSARLAASTLEDALDTIATEAAAAIATESVLDDKQALANVLRLCQEALS